MIEGVLVGQGAFLRVIDREAQGGLEQAGLAAGGKIVNGNAAVEVWVVSATPR